MQLFILFLEMLIPICIAAFVVKSSSRLMIRYQKTAFRWRVLLSLSLFAIIFAAFFILFRPLEMLSCKLAYGALPSDLSECKSPGGGFQILFQFAVLIVAWFVMTLIALLFKETPAKSGQ